jgi:broad specificity phosphatase PhoE
MIVRESGLEAYPCLAEPRILGWHEIVEKLREELVFAVPIRLHLIRHAQSEANAAKLVTGSRDVELSPDGRLQAVALGRNLDSYYDFAFCSQLKRSQETLRLAAESGKVHFGAVVIDSRLNERGLGMLEGQPSRHIPQYDAGDLSWAPQGGESYLSVAQRVLSFLLDLCEVNKVKGIEKVLISSHVGTMRILVGILHGFSDPAAVMRLTFPNAQVSELKWQNLQLPAFLGNTV